MNKTRLPMLIVLVSLVAVIGVSVLTFRRTIPVQGRSLGMPVGIGDLHFFESQQSNSAAGAPANISPYTGMGDVHYFDTQQSILVAAAQAGITPYAGMGDLHRFEAQQKNFD